MTDTGDMAYIIYIKYINKRGTIGLIFTHLFCNLKCCNMLFQPKVKCIRFSKVEKAHPEIKDHLKLLLYSIFER